MAKKQSEILQGTEKEFLDIFNDLCYSRSSWQVWADVISAIACSISNAIDKTPARFEAREKEYEQCIKRLGGFEKLAKLMGIIVMALENNPEQDFLGEMYMRLNLGNHWKGQFFTPYCVCQCMAEINIGTEVEEQVSRNGYISICDPACGAGATLVAAANSFRRHGVDYQRDVMFVGQDIDRVVGQMCYIQLSLLGCPGYIIIADSIVNPAVGTAINPIEKDSQEFWYTPFYFRPIWISRKIKEASGIRKLDQEIKTQQITRKNEDRKGYFFFFINEQEDYCMNEDNKNLSEGLEGETTEEAADVVTEENTEETDSVENDVKKAAEKKPLYVTGEEKLKAEEEEILASVDKKYIDIVKAQFGMVFDELIKKCKEDETFNEKVLLDHKSFSRCIKYCGNKAMGLRNPSDKEKEAARSGSPIVTPVSSDLLFAWIGEYYNLDDKADVEKEKEKPKAVKPNLPAKDSKKTANKPKQSEPVKEEKSKPVKNKNDMEGQFSLFDMF